MAKAAKHVIVEVEQYLDNSYIDTNNVHLPGIYVDSIVIRETLKKPIEKITNNVNTLSLGNKQNPEQIKKL